MPQLSLQPGDRIIELAALAQSAAIFAGAVCSAVLVWVAKRSWLAAFLSVLVGGLLGFVVGLVVGRVLYRSAGDQTTVVRVGAGALSAAVPAGLAGALSSALVVAAVCVLLFSSPPPSSFGVSLGCGAVVGVLFACLSCLL